MLNSVLDLFRSCFSFVYTNLVNIQITDTISAWDMLFTMFIAFGMISIAFRTFGAGGIMHSYGSTTSAIEQRKKQQNKKQNGN